MFQAKNSLVLSGQISDSPTLSHQTHDITFMRFTLNVSRLSGAYDKITILTDSRLLYNLDVTPGAYVEVEGELRSYNNKSGIGNKLLICAFAKTITQTDETHKNDLHLCGTICKAPIYRRTPLGREICDLMIAINRRYGRADYIPCIVWGKNAQIASDFSVGENVEISGRIQSREYIKSTDEENTIRTTYEVSVTTIELQ
ncbi:MAG: single-stranded DNA-binding protein [Clostridia bacterium]|nr:single-stranded DNA-binding protein [Clostridia bacterium]